ncbi:MAG: S-layer homology domain-containing protein [Clostridium argentinense]|uniref:Cellulosome-anchoring protein n=1 Tax=Anaerotignum neopropionicum TaxID=36847 RepID=A0A136WGD2_9FIRM|nr:S-layer homology domain-containing protein [Anaerotignum neopropionicum]KXL53572.1 cellulosome-anchoring protein precursor [Anaerotignum neopropionicum]MBS5822378.1 S-layer homology domain-containing protein [Clostridium argentinense]
MNHKSKRIINILLVVCILITSFVGSAYATRFVFSDSVGHWAEDAINNLARKGVIHGYPDGLSHPDEIITRGEFSALLARIMELEPKETNTVNIVFEDIAGHFAQKEIEALIDEGIIIKEEYDAKYFPDEPITRLEMIKMLVRAIGKEEHNMDCACNTGFTDEDDLTEEEREYICAGKHYNIISGYPDGTIRPDGEATRGEAFEILDRHDEIKEIIEQEDIVNESPVDSPDVEQEDKPSDNGSSSNGGSSYVPAPKYDYTLPNTAYVGEEIKIIPTSRNVKSVAWTVTKNGIPTEISSVLDGELKAEGGVIKIKSTGSYTFSATALNSRGRTVVCEQTVSIYPVISAQFSLPETAHTDTTVAVDLVTENLGDNSLIWTIKKDGKEVDLETVITGELTGSGGLILFKTNGVYELSATITDELGKEVTVSDIITVYPLAEIKMELANITHTDKTITLNTETKNAEEMEIEWSLTQNGKVVIIEDFIEGNIQIGESDIRFKEKGVYNLTASLTDKTGRVFKETVAITVYPVGSAGFYLPEIFHTDDTIKVEATFGEIGYHIADWSLVKDGKEVELPDFITGNLSNDGGMIQFNQKGEYTLKASFTDDGGRTYNYKQALKVYPVPSVSYTLPKYVHTDSDISVDVDSTELDGLKIEWLVDNTFGFQDWSTYVDGNLDNYGGNIQFKRAGIYELVARITDDTGRVFLFEVGGKTEVLPVLSIGFELPVLAYTDSIIDIRTHGSNNVLPVEWGITKDDKPISEIKAFDGSLNAHGGKITFLEEGEYVLTATMTDFLKRSFLYSQNITIKPVIKYNFTMPESIHYGKEFEVETTSENLGNNEVQWKLEKISEPASFSGELSNDGGKISISDVGVFTFMATITDSEGRIFTYNDTITITNTAPTVTITATPTRTVKNGKFFVDIKVVANDADGDAATLEYEGTTVDNYYSVGTHTIKVRAKDIAGAYSPWLEKSFTVINSAPTVTLTATPTRTVKNGKFFVDIKATANDADGDATTLEYDGTTADNYYSVGTHTIRVRAKDIADAYSPWMEKSFAIINSAPTVTLTATPTRTVKNGKFFVDIKATANDADGDATTLEYEGKTADNYYSVGKHTIRVRAKDIAGVYSPWVEKSFTIVNSAPPAPVISRTPNGNSVAPGTKVTITASSTDADNDPITYIWEGRNAEQQVYPLGKNVVRVKAVDSTGAESPWAAIVFFVADSNGGGGMTLTGPDSVILENGLEGATITEYTFTVPPVSGHSGSDHGRVRGYNVLTKQWDQLDYGTTSNGITFSRTLGAGVYSKLEFYYYTNHNCMYNKSNITYSVNYHFE